MANEENKGKKTSEFFHKVGDISKKAAVEISRSAKALYEKGKEDSESRKIKRQEDSYNKRMRKYNPLSVEEFNSENFNIPNIIEIVDEAGRRDIDVCIDTNAIGWRDMVNDTEILHLYDEFAPLSGIQFIPVAKCNEVYCIDPYNRKRFLSVDCIFSKTNEEKIAELEHIAYCLGAKVCSIQMTESEENNNKFGININVNVVESNNDEETDSRSNKKSSKKNTSKPNVNTSALDFGNGSGKITYHSGKKITRFKGSNSPKQPKLKWFAHDDNIKGLIEMRCTDKNSVQYTELSLKGSTSATMNKKVAVAVDKIMKVGTSMSAEKQASKEHNSTLIFEVEF